MEIYTCDIETPLGTVTATAQNGALSGLWFNGLKFPQEQIFSWNYAPDYIVLKQLRAWLTDYFSGLNRPHNLRLAPQGTEFQKGVWNILLKIPFGQVTSYGKIARVIVNSRGLSVLSAQAVGGAVGHNPISILIPCHRVIGANRKLIGYGGGLEKKEALLRVEGINLATVKFYQFH
jgi:methylated-DNA-[protein]-cysteine S-methyltransferase